MLNKSLKTLKGIGEKKAKAFSKLGIDSLLDLIEHYPRRYDDLSHPKKIVDIKDDETVVFLARVISFETSRVSGGKELTKVKLSDDTQSLNALYMNASYIKNMLKKGELYWFYGNVSVRGNYFSTFHPEFTEYSKKPNGLGIRPVYSLSDGIKQSDIINAISNVEPLFSMVSDGIPESIVASNLLLSKDDALRKIHMPKTIEEAELARNRLAFEEIFKIQMYLLSLKKISRCTAKERVYKNIDLTSIQELFPFELTESQIKTIGEVKNDLCSDFYMNRLVFGDVGSGKTVVAIASVLIAVNSGYQACVMAPTEILARQHYDLFLKLIPDSYKISLLTSSSENKKEIMSEIKNGECNIVIGTHAIIQSSVKFNNLSIVVTDEQHRFGVLQRKAFKDKARQGADVLVMSATPIPRTLTMAFYGDLDISYLIEIPKGRKTIITKYVENSEKKEMLKFIKTRLIQGERVYFVAPRIEETDENSMVSVQKLFRYLKKIYADFNPELLHGKVKPEEKDKIMQDFKNGTVQVLVATSVIEVGIDVPEATVMVITDVERFGLSQLHQLRGRIGRGNKQSYCFLTGSNIGDIAQKRIDAMVNETSGFKIAEIDLEIRGPGEILGTRQHGFEKFKIADYNKDYELLVKANGIADEYLSGLSEEELDEYISKIRINQ